MKTNGVLAASWTKQAPVATSATWGIGGGPFNRPLNGKLDECRAERTARPAAWIWACWKNQLSPGQFETIGPVVPLVPSLAVNSSVATAVTPKTTARCGSAAILGRTTLFNPRQI